MQISPPTTCPSCDTELEWSNDQLYCRNLSCPAKTYKQLEHFAKTLKIKGLGPSTIEKLNIGDITDIYELDVDYLTAQLKSEKTAVKLYDEINRSKQESLNTVLPAFGIPLIGKTATDKLAQVCHSIFDIDEAVCTSAGLGPKATKNLLDWLEDTFEVYANLPFSFEFSEGATTSGEAGIVCISGKLNSYPTKAAATEILKSLGYQVKDSLTKDVTILVNESGIETAKTLKAAESGVQIITNLKAFIGE